MFSVFRWDGGNLRLLCVYSGLLNDRRFVLALRGKEEAGGHRKRQTASGDVSEILRGRAALPSARVSQRSGQTEPRHSFHCGFQQCETLIPHQPDQQWWYWGAQFTDPSLHLKHLSLSNHKSVISSSTAGLDTQYTQFCTRILHPIHLHYPCITVCTQLVCFNNAGRVTISVILASEVLL